MFRNLRAAATANTGADAPKAMAPSLRADIYSAIEQAKPWLAGGGPNGGGQAGDGVSHANLLSLVQRHFPDTKMGLEVVGQVEGEVAVVVGGITNMILEMSKWDGMAGAMTMRTWVEALGGAYNKAAEGRRGALAKGISKGINQNTDVTLMTQEFAPKIQIISLLKTVNCKIYGAGSNEARSGEALWSSKFI